MDFLSTQQEVLTPCKKVSDKHHKAEFIFFQAIHFKTTCCYVRHFYCVRHEKPPSIDIPPKNLYVAIYFYDHILRGRACNISDSLPPSYSFLFFLSKESTL